VTRRFLLSSGIKEKMSGPTPLALGAYTLSNGTQYLTTDGVTLTLSPFPTAWSYVSLPSAGASGGGTGLATMLPGSVAFLQNIAVSGTSAALPTLTADVNQAAGWRVGATDTAIKASDSNFWYFEVGPNNTVVMVQQSAHNPAKGFTATAVGRMQTPVQSGTYVVAFENNYGLVVNADKTVSVQALTHDNPNWKWDATAGTLQDVKSGLYLQSPSTCTSVYTAGSVSGTFLLGTDGTLFDAKCGLCLLADPNSLKVVNVSGLTSGAGCPQLWVALNTGGSGTGGMSTVQKALLITGGVVAVLFILWLLFRPKKK